jgi:hypothetical protein
MMQGVVNRGCEATVQIFVQNNLTVLWDGKYREVYVNESETVPLIGMKLLHGYDLHIQAIERGSVTIKPLSPPD